MSLEQPPSSTPYEYPKVTEIPREPLDPDTHDPLIDEMEYAAEQSLARRMTGVDPSILGQRVLFHYKLGWHNNDVEWRDVANNIINT